MTNTLDTGQYTLSEIKKYEAVYGRNFVSPGGLATAQQFIALLNLKPGMKVLDVGCGIGGGALYMAQHFGVQVHGLDLSVNMLTLAHERCREAGLASMVTFMHGDILTFVPPIPYDCIYSRDVFLHIHDKTGLFAALKRCLAPQGILLFTDYCCAEGEKSAEFAAYIRQRDYSLCTVAAYRRWLIEAGFTVLRAEDRTDHFVQILEQELANLAQARFSQQGYAQLSQSWQDKIARARQGEQRWGLFIAQSPSAVTRRG